MITQVIAYKAENAYILGRFVNNQELHKYLLGLFLIIEQSEGIISVSGAMLREYILDSNIKITFSWYPEDFELWVRIYDKDVRQEASILIRNGETLRTMENTILLFKPYL